MKNILLFLSLGILFTSLSLAGNSKNEHPEPDLIFSHDNYKLENFSFISKNFSVGLVNPVFQERTLVILYNKENLIVDSIFTEWEIEKIIPSNDSTFFLLGDNQTLNCIIRKDQMLISGIFAGNSIEKGYDKLAYYSLPLPKGEFQVLKKSDAKREFALQISNGSPQSTLYPFDQKKKHIDIDLFATQSNIYIYLGKTQKLIQIDKTSSDFDEIELNDNSGEWMFFHDYVKDQSYLLNNSRAYQKLYSLSSESKLDYIKDLDFIPEAIFDGALHKKIEKGKNYSHYLIPLDSKEREKIIHLESVTISSD